MSKKRHRRSTKYINSIRIEKLTIYNRPTNDVKEKFRFSKIIGHIDIDTWLYVFIISIWILGKLNLTLLASYIKMETFMILVRTILSAICAAIAFSIVVNYAMTGSF